MTGRAGRPPESAGLCERCLHSRRVPGRAATFWLCRRSEHDRAFPRYPRLPVLRCRGFEAAEQR